MKPCQLFIILNLKIYKCFIDIFRQFGDFLSLGIFYCMKDFSVEMCRNF